MDRYFSGEGVFWLWWALGALGIIFLGIMLATILMVKERPGTGGSRVPLLSTLYKSFKINIRTNRNFVWFLVGIVNIWPFLLLGLIGIVGIRQYIKRKKK